MPKRPETANGPGTGQDGAVPERPAIADATGVGAASTDAARQRLALAQTALLSALVAGAPAPEGFDRERLRVQSRALAAKRASVIAKVAPELPGILGAGYRSAFLAYAQGRPLTGGHRRDALDFAARLLAQDLPADPAARRQLAQWWQDRAGPRPPRSGPVSRLVRAARLAFRRR
ncbi:hypothetical protein LIU39_04070 [Streptomyces sp. SF28]|nr:hypothetical protein [Streptomyces pinistramenti]MCB5906611.1 hypothetical protein [Streptomyces pinistramenti]